MESLALAKPGGYGVGSEHRTGLVRCEFRGRPLRGLYAPADFEPTEHHGLAAAAARIPHGVISPPLRAAVSRPRNPGSLRGLDRHRPQRPQTYHLRATPQDRTFLPARPARGHRTPFTRRRGPQDDLQSPHGRRLLQVPKQGRPRCRAGGPAGLTARRALDRRADPSGGDQASGEVARAITGHVTVAMTDHYAHVDTAEKRAAVTGMLRLVEGGAAGQDEEGSVADTETCRRRGFHPRRPPWQGGIRRRTTRRDSNHAVELFSFLGPSCILFMRAAAGHNSGGALPDNAPPMLGVEP